MNYFSINSGIFGYRLRPSELMVFCAVSSIKNALSFSVCKAESISRRTGLSARTVYRALDGLQAAGLLTKRTRYRYDGTRAANGYHVAPVSGGKFKVDRSIWLHKPGATEFAVYLLLTKTMDNTTRTAYPSLNVISRTLEVCKNTVIAAIRKLQDRCAILKEWQTRKNGGFCCNEHTVLERAKQIILKAKEKGRIALRPFRSLHSACATFSKLCSGIRSAFIVAWARRLFKRASACFGVFTHFLQSG